MGSTSYAVSAIAFMVTGVKFQLGQHRHGHSDHAAHRVHTLPREPVHDRPRQRLDHHGHLRGVHGRGPNWHHARHQPTTITVSSASEVSKPSLSHHGAETAIGRLGVPQCNQESRYGGYCEEIPPIEASHVQETVKASFSWTACAAAYPWVRNRLLSSSQRLPTRDVPLQRTA